MSFPVDMLNGYSHEDLESSAEKYLADLRYRNPNNHEFFSLPDRRKVRTSKYLSLSFLDVPVDLKDLKYPIHNYWIT